MKKIFFLALAIMLLLAGCKQGAMTDRSDQTQKIQKLHWFIPDGVRAEPELFKIFEWAEEGKLPNIKRLMDMGSYGYSIPTFPSHTPTNFATLLTGVYPEVHGVADGPMHTEGHPLANPSVKGFSSSARKVPAIWSILEDSGRDVVLLSMPGSTPPELKRNGITIRGRWGGWGADFYSLIFEKNDAEQRKKMGRGNKLFFLGYELTRFVDAGKSEWPYEFDIFGQKIYAKIDHDKMLLSKDKKTILFSLGEGDLSEWTPVEFDWKNNSIDSHVRFRLIILDGDFFRIRAIVDNLNRYITDPGSAAEDLEAKVGPMVDFVDNFPPQLIYYNEDKEAFLEEANLSFKWHQDAVDAIYDLYDPDVFIHDIYTPNQMLTSRWWMGYIDPTSKRYDDVSDKEREQLWSEVSGMYLELDKIVGKAIDHADPGTLIVLSSDHGAVPLNKWVRLNNLFAKKGWLKYKIDEKSGAPVIDYNNSKVIYLKMDNVYINPDGLGGDWTRASGEEYEKLRLEVMNELLSLRDPSDPDKPVVAVVRWENVKEFLDLPADRVGDLVIANYPGYGWNEELTEDGKIFDDSPLKSGYKQAIFAKDTPGMWTPFIIAGPGIKKHHFVQNPIEMVDQMPTILKAMGEKIPSYVQGHPVEEIFI